MTEFIVDFHLHSKYSRAVSRDMDLEHMSEWGVKKGIQVLAAADFTHPAWFKELSAKLELQKNGLYKLRGTKHATHFLLSTELSCIYTQGDKTRRIHLLVIMPTLEAVSTFTKSIVDEGGNVRSDGRPILGITAEKVVELTRLASSDAFVIPAHIWTPWFSMFGSKSGFDSVEECFGKQAQHIHAVETGLSSDPAMNWRLQQLDRMQIVSSSDAHSFKKMGREATVFSLERLGYKEIKSALESPTSKNKISYTIEFFPEEGKYHFDGHVTCGIRFAPGETKRVKGICPQCGRQLTIGVLSRVEELADRKETFVDQKRPPFKSIVPLEEIIADAFHVGVSSKKVQQEYEAIIKEIGNEFFVLLNATTEQLKKVASPIVVEGIMRVRAGKLHILPGYDGEFGTVNVFSDEERELSSQQKSLL